MDFDIQLWMEFDGHFSKLCCTWKIDFQAFWVHIVGNVNTGGRGRGWGLSHRNGQANPPPIRYYPFVREFHLHILCTGWLKIHHVKLNLCFRLFNSSLINNLFNMDPWLWTWVFNFKVIAKSPSLLNGSPLNMIF